MKRVILSLLAATALVGTAAAADLPRGKVAPAYIPPVFTWTGFYAGLNAGYAFNGDSDLKDVSFNGFTYANGGFDAERKSDDGSFTGGLQFGYNYQMGSVVLGVEADFNYAAVEKTYVANTYVGNVIIDELHAKSKTEWYGTLRPRIGFTPMDRLMVYVTGGLAYGQVKTNAVFSNDSGYELSARKTDTRYGWTVGAGVEYAVTNNITVRGEYAYVDLGEDKHYFQAVNGNTLTWKDPTNFHVVRAAVNYKF